MNQNNLRPLIFQVHWRHLLGGLIVATLCLMALAAIQFRFLMNELERESSDLHRRASQLVGQHDAHLTSLSAIAVASAGQRSDLFLEVSAAVSQFYPRIDAVFLVPLDAAQDVIGSTQLSEDNAETLRKAAMRSTGLPELLVHPTRPEHYLLVKRSPNSEAAQYALALSIDAEHLITNDSVFWTSGNALVRLLMPDGTIVSGTETPEEARFSKPLASASQPLSLQTTMRLSLSELLPFWQALTLGIIAVLSYTAILIGLRQRGRLRIAEREADLARVEAKLTHAMRINSLGEMASGMAHELTQPLTAILAQLQAGQRLLARGETNRLAPVLQDAVDQSRRSAAILERLRNWSRPQRGQLDAIDLRSVVWNAHALLAPVAEEARVRLSVDAPANRISVLADQIEIEQAVHNLVRNALDALTDQSNARVDIRLSSATNRAVIEVSDNGPGVDESILPQLFSPFATTREDGTGLGLALCQRLVERAGGEITHSTEETGATFRIVLPLANLTTEAAQ